MAPQLGVCHVGQDISWALLSAGQARQRRGNARPDLSSSFDLSMGVAAEIALRHPEDYRANYSRSIVLLFNGIPDARKQIARAIWASGSGVNAGVRRA